MCDPFTVIVPYRNRHKHIRRFVLHMVDFLRERNFSILVVEQADCLAFNRGALLNIGSLLVPAADYIAFHDVDMLPVDSTCDYSTPVTGICHLAGRVEQFGYGLPYRNYCGGVLLVSRIAFSAINGFSNRYWGWGCEDDDLALRSLVKNIPIERRSGLYESLPHALAPSYEAARNHTQFQRRLQHYVSREAHGPIDPKVFRRIPLETLVLNTYPQEEIESDGVSTVRFSVDSRMSLRSYLGGSCDISLQHQLVRVILDQE
jgi:hypothetical protein